MSLSTLRDRYVSVLWGQTPLYIVFPFYISIYDFKMGDSRWVILLGTFLVVYISTLVSCKRVQLCDRAVQIRFRSTDVPLCLQYKSLEMLPDNSLDGTRDSNKTFVKWSEDSIRMPVLESCGDNHFTPVIFGVNYLWNVNVRFISSSKRGCLYLQIGHEVKNIDSGIFLSKVNMSLTDFLIVHHKTLREVHKPTTGW